MTAATAEGNVCSGVLGGGYKEINLVFPFGRF